MTRTLLARLRFLLRGLREPGPGGEAEGRVLAAVRQWAGRDGP